jgi:predicted negative regulator of RcsB-dependent stress response
MIRGFDALDGGFDFAVLVVVMLLTVVAALAWMVREARRECAQQQRRAEEAETWLMLTDEEVEAVRRRLADVERRHGNLQSVYAQLTRRLLAKNFYEIEQQVRRKRQME